MPMFISKEHVIQSASRDESYAHVALNSVFL